VCTRPHITTTTPHTRPPEAHRAASICASEATPEAVGDPEAPPPTASGAHHRLRRTPDRLRRYDRLGLRASGVGNVVAPPPSALPPLISCAQSCVFLLPDNKCSIHTTRPGQCSTYPWWPELMDEEGWQVRPIVLISAVKCVLIQGVCSAHFWSSRPYGQDWWWRRVLQRCAWRVLR
jgi:Fe-S-cluster containining protein